MIIFLLYILFFYILTYFIFKLNPNLPKLLEQKATHNPNFFIAKVTALAELDDNLIWFGSDSISSSEYNEQYQKLCRLKGLKQNQNKSIGFENGRLVLI